MSIKKLKEQLKKEGYQRPNVKQVTPEIRTCDEYAQSEILNVDEE